MAELSTKPYLIRAIYEWCTDSGYRPHIAVVVDEGTVVPREFVRNGEIVLNVSAAATNRLRITNEVVEFEARFGGIARSVSVPIDNVTAIYAQETGHGMAFDVPKALALVPEPEPEPAGEDAGAAPVAAPAGVDDAGNGKAGDAATTGGPESGGDRETGVAAQAADGAGAAARVRRRPKLTAVPTPAVAEVREAAAPKSPKRRRKGGPVKVDQPSAPAAEEAPPSGRDPEPRPPSGPPRLTRVK